ncbi:hypothetical protein CQW23_16506 [Capsicum baccatum]|uniref:Uncharacterized protein n=1 Tax=Capsicum baccatum TaxID=33114 RepID=A0A2G2WB52_CAPBA|nr:hypothetical protein CQW23_16506 [Capsicum baccatum]
MEDEEETKQILKILKALKQASQQLQTNPQEADNTTESDSSSSSAIKALLDLDTESDSLLSSDPNLSNLSHHISDLKILISSLHKSKVNHGRIKSFLTRRVKSHEITRVAEIIESEIQDWIDRESIMNLTSQLQQIRSRTDLLEFAGSSSSQYEEEMNHTSQLQQIRSTNLHEEEDIIEKLSLFHDRLSQGFNINLQDLLLKSNIFSELEFLLCNCNVSQRVREKAGYALKEVVLFNKDVFVGQVLMGQTIKSLVSVDSLCSLEVLISLIRAIRSPFVDVIESVGGISKVISYLNSDDLALKVMAMDCILEIAYFGRKEAIESMLNCELIKKLVQLQRSELGGDLIDLGKAQLKEAEVEEEDKGNNKMKKKKRGYGEKRYLERHPFASCVARFGVQLEVGEGLRQREKRGFKQEILKKIREACDTDAEAATIVAEVLWGSSP